MGKIAFLFPGQGAQYTGMGKEFYEKEKTAAGVFDTASKVTGLNLPALCFEENGDLNQTQYTQIAMLTDELAILSVLKEHGIRPAVTAGLSLGEYGAIVASGIMRMEDAFRVVRERGIYMQEAVPVGGAMSAVLGLAADVVERVCEETEGTVTVANYNCPGQLVVAGDPEQLGAFQAKVKEAGGRAAPLAVSGGFHSPLMESAAGKLLEALGEIPLGKPSLPIYANATAQPYEGDMGALLVRQVKSPVRWQETIEALAAEGVDTFFECGPGKTLCGLIKKTIKTAKAYQVQDAETLQAALEAFRA